MNYKLVDDLNTKYLDGDKELHNLDEIIAGVRGTIDFVGWHKDVPVIILLIFLALTKISIMGSLILNYNGVNSAIMPIIAITVLILINSYLAYGIYRSIPWFRGKNISDKQIIKNMLSQGIISYGMVTKISNGVLHYKYKVGDFNYEKRFPTQKWGKFKVGDKVVVLYALANISCLL